MNRKEYNKILKKMSGYVDNEQIIQEIKLLIKKMWKYEWENGVHYKAHSINNECGNDLIMKETSDFIVDLRDKIKKLFLKLKNNQNKEIIKEIQWLITEESSCQYLSGGECAQFRTVALLNRHLGESGRAHYKIAIKIDKLFEKLGQQNE